MTPEGVAGASVGRPWSRKPAFAGWKPSTSFIGSIALMTRSSSICSGRGSCVRIPVTRGSAFRSATSASRSASDVSAESSWWIDSMPASAQASRFMRT